MTINGIRYHFDDAQVEAVTFDGGDGYDLVVLDDSIGDDTLTAEAKHAVFSNSDQTPGFIVTMDGFEELQAYAKAGGFDSAYLYDSAGNDKFKSEPTESYAKMYGGRMYNRVKFFESVDAYSTAGKDLARLFDTRGDDTFEGQKDQSRLYGMGFSVTAHSFPHLVAYAVGGDDQAYLDDSAGDDTIRARAHKTELYDTATLGEVYKITVRRFDQVHARANTSSGGYDKIKLHDTFGDNRFVATGSLASLFKENQGNLDLLYDAQGFEWVKAYSTAGTDIPEVDPTVPYAVQIEGPWQKLYLSLENPWTPPGLKIHDEDIAAFDGIGFSQYFDGSDVGVKELTVDAFDVIGPDQILMSFTEPGLIPGISTTVDDSDIVKFTATQLGPITAGVFELYFDASDVGLDTDGEDVDTLNLLDDGRLVVSTTGLSNVAGAAGNGEDLLVFTPTSLGDATAGTWTVYFDGSDVAISGASENLNALAIDANGQVCLSTTDAFSTADVSGEDEDAFVFTPTSLGPNTTGTFQSTLRFDGSSHGLADNAFTGLDLSPANSVPTAVADGPYSIQAGQDLALAGTASFDPDSAWGDKITSYEWDLDNDGLFEYEGATLTVPWADLELLPAPVIDHPVSLRVGDDWDVLNTYTTTLTINGVFPPPAPLSGSYVQVPADHTSYSTSWIDDDLASPSSFEDPELQLLYEALALDQAASSRSSEGNSDAQDNLAYIHDYLMDDDGWR